MVSEGRYRLRRVPRRSPPVTQPRGWLVLAGPSWQCEPLAPPDMTEGDWGTGRHLPLKYDAPWCPRVPRFELGPAIKWPGWARGETEGGCRLPPRLNTVVTHTALPSADSDVLVPWHLT